MLSPYDTTFYGGWRNVKLLSTGECRKIRDCCIFRGNDCEIFPLDIADYLYLCTPFNMQFPIYICAFRRCGCQRNGSHRSSNGIKYSYTKFRTTHIFASIPFELLRPDLLEPIKQFFSKFSDEEIKYSDWEPEEYEVIESEIDIEALINTLNGGLNPCYSNRVFIKGDKDSCPYPTGFGFVSTTYDEIDYTN